MVPEPRRAPGRRGPRGHVPDPSPVGPGHEGRRARGARGRARAPHQPLHRRRAPPHRPGAGLRRRLPGTCPARRRLRRGAHGVVPVLLAAGRRGGAPAAPLRPRGRLARGVDARLLARVPGPGRRRGLARAAPVRPHPPARVLLLAPARRPPAGRGPARRGHRARGRVRRAARAPARPRAPRAHGGVRRAPHPREARARARARGGPGARAAARPAGRDLRRRPRAPGGAGRGRAAGLGDAVDVPGFVAAERVDSALAEGR